jgi:alanine dehydrogenase
MMPGFAEALGVMGIKVISVFHANRNEGLPSHQGVVILFDAKHGQPLMIFDAAEITAIRTAAASAVATRLLSRQDSASLAIIGSGEQAQRHIESMSLVRKITQVNIWSRNEDHSTELVRKLSRKSSFAVTVKKSAQDAVKNADIICTVTSSSQPVINGDWVSKGAHINAVGSSTAVARELDTVTVVRSRLFTDCYDSLFNEAGDFLIPKKEGAVTENQVKGEVGEVLLGKKKGRESDDDITIFKSLGIAAEDIFSAWHIYQKIKS